ncbi:hypothetical protein B0T20DRAFT_276234 [Sordaria brevicollis]|uniref:Uncharacterized protein n=1 Tax=Sordaria brevicollis TaxID=83679 RepID=A0AAE0PB27_SORBR|nr:hypothetical protein B0T20DRAFT_276234 [Sordaria brevicollis]
MLVRMPAVLLNTALSHTLSFKMPFSKLSMPLYSLDIPLFKIIRHIILPWKGFAPVRMSDNVYKNWAFDASDPDNRLTATGVSKGLRMAVSEGIIPTRFAVSDW